MRPPSCNGRRRRILGEERKMKKSGTLARLLSVVLLGGFCATASAQPNAAPVPAPVAAPTSVPAATPATLPREWIDPDTGHRVIRISNEPGTQSMYFHQNAY